MLPKDLTTIGADAFNGCDFSGVLKLPVNIASIGNRAFAGNWRLMGVVEFPDGLQTIGSDAFSNCRSLEGLIIPESIETYKAMLLTSATASARLYVRVKCHRVCQIILSTVLPRITSRLKCPKVP